MYKLGIGILCYNDRYIHRILNWVRKLNNRDKINVVIYHDNIPFDDNTCKLIESYKIKIIEGFVNNGMFVSRLRLMDYLNNSGVDAYLMCDDDDMCVSDIYDICSKYYPFNETSCVYFCCDTIRSADKFCELMNSHKITNSNTFTEQCYYASNTLFNPKINNGFIKSLINYSDFIKQNFGTLRINAGEDETLILLHSEYNRYQLGKNTKTISNEVAMICDDLPKPGKYESNDYRYSKDDSIRNKERLEFDSIINDIQSKYRNLLNEVNYPKIKI